MLCKGPEVLVALIMGLSGLTRGMCPVECSLALAMSPHQLVELPSQAHHFIREELTTGFGLVEPSFFILLALFKA